MRHRKMLLWAALFVSISVGALTACSAPAVPVAATEAETSPAETVQETTEAATEAVTEAEVATTEAAVPSLIEIFGPDASSYDGKTGEVTVTEVQRQILADVFQITEDSYRIEVLVAAVAREIDYSEAMVTEAEIESLIREYSEYTKKLSEEEQRALYEETVQIMDRMAYIEGGYYDSDEEGNSVWLSAEEHFSQRDPSIPMTIIDLEPVTMYAVDSVNIRSDCSTSADDNIIGKLNYRDDISVTGISADKAWYRVSLSEEEAAFVWASYLSDTKPERPAQSQPSGGGSAGQGGGSGSQEQGGGGSEERPAWQLEFANGGNGAGWTDEMQENAERDMAAGGLQGN